jgi:hypothetical protein
MVKEEQILVVIDGGSIAEVYTERQLPLDFSNSPPTGGTPVKVSVEPTICPGTKSPSKRSPLCDPHLSADNQPRGLDMLTGLNKSLTDVCGDPGSDAQNLKDFARRQLRQCKPANLFLLIGQLHRTTLPDCTALGKLTGLALPKSPYHWSQTDE